MKKFIINLLTLCLSVLFGSSVFAAGINTGGGAVPFGSNTQYSYGIMPTNLPSGGTYGASQKAAEAYEAWKGAYVKSDCGSGLYRVVFDDGYSTVSEGIAYGMLLSVYADDKAVFDGLWAYYQANMNGNGVMNWKISGCSGVSGANGATDAELDAAMALIIAYEQWGTESYLTAARSLIQKIKTFEMATDGQTLNGDAWGNTNTCRNPSYFAPAYYTEFAKVDTDNATFWSSTAISASNTILTANRNPTSGLVSNWCDNSGTENACGNTGSGAYGYGADACRNPWRMAVDYLWHGTSASTAAKDINAKLISFVNGYENQLKGPFSNLGVSNPSGGSYVNGSYTTFALPPMTSSSAQSSLNKCYTAVANLANVDAYFNSTIRCITMFVLTGNFWAPGASGFVFPPSVSAAETDVNGNIVLTMNKTMSGTSSLGSNFTVYYNNVAQSGIISSVTISGKTITLNVSTAPKPGQNITLSYNGNGNIKSTEDAAMETFTKIEVISMVAGNETILDDCEDGNEFNNVGGIWFTFNDVSDQAKACTPGTSSTISPLSGKNAPVQMTAGGCTESPAYSLYCTYKLGSNYTPYNGGSCASWTNPAYVGIGTWVDDVETSSMDWSSGTGVTFYYKGPACAFQVIISEVTDYCFHKYDVPACSNWTKITVKWADLAQPTWGTPVTFSADHVLKLQWQFEVGTTGVAGSSGNIAIDEVHILGMPPVELTALTISPVSDDDLADDDCSANIDPLKIPIASSAVGDTLYLETTPTPLDASYPVVYWTSSDETVATVDYKGRVLGVGYGEATITARSKMHQNISTTYTVKVPAPSVKPTGISFAETAYEVTVGETTTIIASFSPTGVTETGLTWTSSDNTKATVSSSGVVTGVAPGPVTITATSTADGCSGITKSVTVTVKDVAVTNFSVDKEALDIVIGETGTITATVEPASVSQEVTAVSNATGFATVSVSGNVVTVTSKAVGTANVTVTSKADPTYSEVVAVTVTAVPITSVTLDKNTDALYVGSATTLTPTVLPSNATQTITWTSSNESVATVSGGVVTAVAAGTATIKATSTQDNTKYAECVVTVNNVPVSSVSVAPTSNSLEVLETVQLGATVLPANAFNKEVTWSSSDETVATVDEAGLVTAKKIGGPVTITATAKDGSGKSATSTITVVATKVTTITLLPISLDMKVGEVSSEITATVAPAGATDKTYTWSSSDDAIATVDAGVVTAVKAGTCSIYATAKDGSNVKGTCAVTVTNVLPTSITMATTLGFTVGDGSKTLTPTVAPENTTDKTLTWSSSDDAIATVVDGVVTPVGEGTCTITATSNADATVKAVCTVTIVESTVSVIGVTLDATATVSIGKTITLTPTVAPNDATDKSVTWASANEAVAMVDANGVVTGKTVGIATITVTTTDGSKTAECTVTVEAIAVTKIELDKYTLSYTMSSTPEQLTATITPEDATDKTITWSSDNESVATVNTSGVVTPVAIGSCNIIATATNDVKSSACVVTVSAIAVESVTINETPVSGMTMRDASVALTATVLPADATTSTITWSSTDETVATVVGGVVTFKKVGTTTITATAGGVSGTYALVINAIPVESVSLDKATMELTAGAATGSLTATVLPEDATNKAITWTSSDEAIVTVANGVVTPLAKGTATITVTTTDGNKTAECVVTVVENTTPVTGVSLTPADAAKTVALNESLSFTAIVAPTTATNQNVSWASSDESVATVVDGELTLLKAGTTKITVTTEDGSFTASCDVTVTEILTKTIVIDNALSLKVGENKVLTTTITPVGASTTLTWESSKPSVATVDQTGKVSAVSAGKASVTATSTDGTSIVSNVCEVTVSNIDVTGVTLDATTAVVRVGGTVTLTATILPANATIKGVDWTSSKTDVATVNTNGIVSALALGTTTITVKSAADAYIKTTCSIEVVNVSVLTTEISSANTALSAAVEGTQVGQYKTGSKATYQAAIAVAQAVIDNAASTQAQVDAALITLQDAGKAFAKALISNETLIFNAELTQENMTQMSTFWFSFNDATASSDPTKCGSSVVTPLSTEANPFTMSTTGYDGTGKAAMIEYTLEGAAALGYNPFVGMGLNFDKTAGVAFDMTGSTGISFWIKSDSKVYFEVEQSNITDACDFFKYLPVYSDWTLVELTWDELAQYTWGTQVSWDLTKLTKCQWKVQELDGETGQVWIDQVKILGVALDLPEIIDYTDLYTAIAEAQTALDAAVVGDKDGNYPQSAVTTFTSAITTASALIDNAETQSEVATMVNTLNAALETFSNAVIVVERDVLSATIATAKNYYSTTQEGYEVGMYIAGSRATLLTAIDAAETVFNTEAVSQAEVDAANTALNEAITTFLNSEFDPNSINRTALQTAITDATTLVSSAVEGQGDGQYAAGSKATLNSAIETAQGVYDNLSSSQSQVDAATSTLRTAITAFQNAKITVSKTSLTAAIATANATYSAATEGTNKGNYPAGSKAVLLSAIAAAQSVADNSSASQTQVDAAVTTLNKAVSDFKALVITVDKTQLVYQITRANESLKKADGNTGDGSGQYPASAVSVFTDAINYAQQINQTSTDQTTVDGEVTVLIQAISDFEKSVNPTVVVVDLTQLAELLSEADSLLENTRNRCDHLLEYIELATRRNNAKTEYEKETHEQANVEIQVEFLAEAIEVFKNVFTSNVAIDDVENVTLSTYPNPCQNVITFSAGKEIQSIAVVNVAGSTEFVVEVTDTQKPLDVMSLKAGIYFAKVVYRDGTVEVVRFAKR